MKTEITLTPKDNITPNSDFVVLTVRITANIIGNDGD